MNRDQILAAIQNGTITKAELKLALDEGIISLGDVDSTLQSNPDRAKFYADQMAAQERGEKVAVASGVLDLLKNIGYTGFALNQIGTANRMMGQNPPPSLPSVPGLSPELSQAIYNAQRGVDLAPAIEPARQGIEDAYQGALTRAASASGGQAGSYQAMASAANADRMRAQLGLAPLAQQAQLQNQESLNSLLNARMNERQQQYINSLYGSQIAFDQYNRAQDAIGGLGAAGYTNLLDAAGRVAGSLQDLSPYYSGFDRDTQDYMEKVRQENIGNMSISRNPYQSYSGVYDPNQGPYGNV